MSDDPNVAMIEERGLTCTRAQSTPPDPYTWYDVYRGASHIGNITKIPHEPRRRRYHATSTRWAGWHDTDEFNEALDYIEESSR